MHCRKCGAELTDEGAFCPACGASTKRKRKKPMFLIRLVLQVFSLALYIVLTVSLLATALLADVRILTSTGGIHTILTHIVSPNDADQPTTTGPAMGAAGVVLCSDSDDYYGYDVDEDGNIIAPDGTIIGNINDPDSIEIPEGTELPDDLEIPPEALTSSSALAEYVHEVAQQILGEDVDITPEQILTFIEESTIMEFVAEKTAAFVEDILTGTENPAPIITTDEIIQLVEDNETVIEQTFQVEITDEMKQDMAVQIQETVDEGELNTTIRAGVDQVMQEPVPGTNGLTVSDLMAKVQLLTQTRFLAAAAAVCLVLMGLLMLLSFYNLPRGLRRSASACMVSGSLLSAPLAILHFAPALLSGILPQTAETLKVIDGAAMVVSPIHYGLLAFGVVLLIVSIVWRTVTKNR